ncbi:hypothetical protein COO60DRAFT_118329 [Scenedesmus sp. NREL 46B-D3]|nr:hypothetical protein COO60DRAFT_118329 [Scenedesmus sp. NREL 46B-D3]
MHLMRLLKRRRSWFVQSSIACVRSSMWGTRRWHQALQRCWQCFQYCQSDHGSIMQHLYAFFCTVKSLRSIQHLIVGCQYHQKRRLMATIYDAERILGAAANCAGGAFTLHVVIVAAAAHGSKQQQAALVPACSASKAWRGVQLSSMLLDVGNCIWWGCPLASPHCTLHVYMRMSCVSGLLHHLK